MIPHYGVYTGIVVATNDPQGRGRVTLRIPQLSGLGVTGWAEPVLPGTVQVGDVVQVAYDGGDINHPLFWPRPTTDLGAVQAGWRPLTLQPGWAPSANPIYDAPRARLTADGMIEVEGTLTNNTIPAPGNTLVARLPEDLRPAFDTYTSGAVSSASANLAQMAHVNSSDGGWVVQGTAFTNTLVDTPGPMNVDFVAPASGRVFIETGSVANVTDTNSEGQISVRLLLGAAEILAPNESRAAKTRTVTAHTISTGFQATGLVPGNTYRAEGMYQYTGTAAAGARFNIDNRWLRVDPGAPNPNLGVRIGLWQNGDVRAYFPLGTASSPLTLFISSVRVRAAL